MTVIANVRKGQTDMPYRGTHQTLITQSKKHYVCPGDTCPTTLSAIVHVRDRSNVELHISTAQTKIVISSKLPSHIPFS